MKFAIVATVAVLSTACVQAQQQFRITVTNIGDDTPLAGQVATGGQPLSPVFVSVGSAAFDIFQAGGFASNGIKKIAEGGDFVPLKNYADTQLGGSVFSDAVLGGGPFKRGQSVSGLVWADTGHDYFSFASMLGHTNDSFIGESVSTEGIHLLPLAGPLNTTLTIYGRNAWDAGTELNTQNAVDLGFLGGLGNPDDTNPRIRTATGIQAGVGDSWKYMENWSATDRLATIQIQSVPEPTTMAVLGMAVLGLLRKKRRA